MFPGHCPKVAVSQSRYPWRRVACLTTEQSLKVVYRHGLQHFRKVDLLDLMQNRFQLRRAHFVPCTRILGGESRPPALRPPAQGLGEQVLDVTKRFLFHHSWVGLKQPYFLW